MKSVQIDDIPRYTYSDYEQWEGCWELIREIPYAMSPLPTLEHQRLSQKIGVALERVDFNLNDCTIQINFRSIW